MMLRPEHFPSDSLNHLSAHSDRNTAPSGRQRRVLAEAPDVDALVASLMPQGVSPAKQAVIERLIMKWVSNAERDVA